MWLDQPNKYSFFVYTCDYQNQQIIILCLNSKMKLRNKKSYLLQSKTSTSYSNATDPFLKSESSFLQKFFRYNLSDYFHQNIYNLQQDSSQIKPSLKGLKLLQGLTFTAKREVNIKQFSSVINEFYQSSNQQGDVSFKYLYCNTQIKQLEKDEKFIMWVKMRSQVQIIENLPHHILTYIQRICDQSTLTLSQQEQFIRKNIKNGTKNVINLFIAYFGDINFQLFDKKNYEQKEIELFGGVSSVRIHVFYVSRLSLINKFNKINRIDDIDSINSLLIQLYEARRQRIKNKRRKHVSLNQLNKSNRMTLVMNVLKWSTVLSAASLLTLFFLKLIF